MNILEILSYLSNIAMGIAVIYTAFSIRSWRRQSVISRRADNANKILEELEFFYLELEQLVSWHYFLDWREWGASFKETRCLILENHSASRAIDKFPFGFYRTGDTPHRALSPWSLRLPYNPLRSAPLSNLPINHQQPQ